MAHYNIVPAVFLYFFKDLHVLPAVLCTIHIDCPILLFQIRCVFKVVLGLVQTRSEKLSTRTAV